MVDTFLFTDLSTTTLAAPLSSVATTITLATGTGVRFPNPTSFQKFAITLRDALTGNVYETCHVTSRAGDALTVRRGQEGTMAVAWLLGDYVFHGPTAGQQQAFLQLSGSPVYGIDIGAVNAMAVTLPLTVTSYAPGMMVRVLVANDNTSPAPTLVVGSGPAVVVTTPDAQPLIQGQLQAGQVAEFIYDGTQWQYQTRPTFVETWSYLQEFNNLTSYFMGQLQ